MWRKVIIFRKFREPIPPGIARYERSREYILGCCLPMALIAGFIATTLPGQTYKVVEHDATVLEPGKGLQGSLAGGQSHEYRFQLGAGEYARVVVEQHSIDLAVACLGPGGHP